MMNEEVSLQEILTAREKRVEFQNRLLEGFGVPIVSLTVNMPGPVKLCHDSVTVFRAACEEIREALAGKIIYLKMYERKTGCEGYFITEMPAFELKRKMCEIEDNHILGRLFDADVLDPGCGHISRTQLGLSQRSCMVCGKEGTSCSRSRAHSLEELSEAVVKRVEAYRKDKKARIIADAAYNALVEEVLVSPKPGLVDRENNGAHKDMTVAHFLKSAEAIKPYFYAMGKYALECSEMGADPLPRLREIGKSAEKAMHDATNGVNTHKGAIFSLGLLCAAAAAEKELHAEKICFRAASMTRGICSSELGKDNTNGARAFLQSEAKGARGEAESGFENVRKFGLPVYAEELKNGKNEAAVKALVSLMANVRDTNVLTRGGNEGEALVATEALKLLKDFSIEKVRELDKLLISRNISPGGCADLLAVTLFLHNLQNLQTEML